ncbi:hypothetical protein B4135_4008 [Caldibacillus debilis]|uniref:Uncharacterized protein n=1 Tax=Caldibacillus debilis TaxID=301148 RepID=A0A150L7K1_9BACI|nr:hypothetical protein B4135_4008 [Caldibacillus debilis]
MRPFPGDRPGKGRMFLEKTGMTGRESGSGPAALPGKGSIMVVGPASPVPHFSSQRKDGRSRGK